MAARVSLTVRVMGNIRTKYRFRIKVPVSISIRIVTRVGVRV